MKVRVILILALLLMLLPAQTVFAQSRGAEITNITCETYTDLVRYTFDLEIWGMRGQDVIVAIWLVYTDSDYMVEFDGTAKEADYYSDADGNVITGEILTPEYRSTLWEEFVLEIPMSVIPPGDYEFYPHFQVQDMDGNVIRWQSHPLCSLPRPEGRSAPVEDRSSAPVTLPQISHQPLDWLWTQRVQ
ncbi:MAG TPA: hypothetical protein VHP83_18410 [Aggregatilineaceae bacterium]|nr:hypothetical protein [Aggregatilineaceae bacterium]